VLPVSVRSRITQDYAIMQKLGAGSFSTVHLLRRYNSHEHYALKEFGHKYKHGHTADRTRAHSEYQYGTSLGEHPHTVKYLQLYEDDANLFILMEYCARGNLEQFLKQHSVTPLRSEWGENMIWRFIRDLLSVRCSDTCSVTCDRSLTAARAWSTFTTRTTCISISSPRTSSSQSAAHSRLATTA
jgi:serine/threonine protein kinase